MKNKIFLFIIAFLFVILCGCSSDEKEDVAVTVYNNDILIADIKNEIENSKLVYEKNIEQINNLNINDEEKTKLLDKIGNPKTYSEILNEKIEYFVLLHEFEKIGLNANFENCKNEARKVFTDLNSVTEDDFENYQTLLAIKNYMSVYNLSDEEYIEILANQYYDNVRINLLKKHFKDNLYVHSQLSFEQQYSKYVKQLVDDAKVVYYDNVTEKHPLSYY